MTHPNPTQLTGKPQPRHASKARKTKRLDSRVEERIWDFVDAYATENGYTISSAVHRILRDWMRMEQAKTGRFK